MYNLAADMGGMGFIEANKARCMLSVLINTHLLEAARRQDVQRFFFSSSACVYAADKQLTPDLEPLREADAYPAEPEDGYGWEKLFSERMCRHFTEDFGLITRVARYHNVYGPHGTWTGGREKAPAAICRKIAEAQISGRHEIEIWGDGEQTRSFMFIDDCVAGTRRIMDSDIDVPINLGSSEMVTINGLVDIVEEIAGIKVARRYDLDAPKGVRGPQQRQHDDPRAPGLGAEHHATRRPGADLPLDPRPGVRDGAGRLASSGAPAKPGDLPAGCAETARSRDGSAILLGSIGVPERSLGRSAICSVRSNRAANPAWVKCRSA